MSAASTKAFRAAAAAVGCLCLVMLLLGKDQGLFAAAVFAALVTAINWLYVRSSPIPLVFLVGWFIGGWLSALVVVIVALASRTLTSDDWPPFGLSAGVLLTTVGGFLWLAEGASGVPLQEWGVFGHLGVSALCTAFYVLGATAWGQVRPHASHYEKRHLEWRGVLRGVIVSSLLFVAWAQTYSIHGPWSFVLALGLWVIVQNSRSLADRIQQSYSATLTCLARSLGVGAVHSSDIAVTWSRQVASAAGYSEDAIDALSDTLLIDRILRASLPDDSYSDVLDAFDMHFGQLPFMEGAGRILKALYAPAEAPNETALAFAWIAAYSAQIEASGGGSAMAGRAHYASDIAHALADVNPRLERRLIRAVERVGV